MKTTVKEQSSKLAEINIDDDNLPIPSTWEDPVMRKVPGMQTRLFEGASAYESEMNSGLNGYNVDYEVDTRDGQVKHFGDADLGMWIDGTLCYAVHHHAPSVTLIVDHGDGRVERIQAMYGPVTARSRAESTRKKDEAYASLMFHESVCEECELAREPCYD